MSDPEIIDYVYAELEKSAKKSILGFQGLSGSWGYKSSGEYMAHEALFIECMNAFALDVSIRFFDNSFYCFDGKIWVSVSEDAIEAGYDRFLRQWRILNKLWDHRAFKRGFLDVIRFNNPLAPSKSVIAFNNGVLNLETLEFNKFSKKYHVTYYHPYAYNTSAKCPMWQSFLKEVLPDDSSRRILQMFLGLGLIERGTAYNPFEGKDRSKIELCLLLVGAGANGKSVIYQTAMGIFGRNRISGLDYDDLVGIGDEGMRARRLLRDSLFNWSSDSDPRTFGRKHTNTFKKIVSGEPVTDRMIGGNVEENDMMPYLVFNLNELPFPDDASLGFIRRLQVIPFYYTVPKERQDKSLPYKLTSEYSGIFNWIVRGMRELRRRRFVFPSAVGSEMLLLQTQMKKFPVDAWVRTYRLRSKPDVDGEQPVIVPMSDIRSSIDQFCEDNDVTTPPDQTIGAAMRRMGFMKKRTSSGFQYYIYGNSRENLMVHMLLNEEPVTETEDILDPASCLNKDD